MVRKLIGGNKVGVSGIYEPDENTSLVIAYDDLNNYVYNQNSTQIIANIANTINDLYIKPDETKVYFIDNTSDCIHQYNLSGENVTPDYFNNKQLVLGLQETDPVDIYFKPDGTEVYITGQTGVAPLTANSDYIHQYTLGTSWDIATAGYTTSFLVTTQTTTPNATYIGSAGTAMYVLGGTNVYQYTLATPWNVSTASYASKTVSVNAQETSPGGMFFKDDGIKMYIVGQTNDRVYQYTLSTAWDVSTATYDNKNISIVNQDGASHGLYFKPDGKKFYLTGGTGYIYEFDLYTAWDVSTASYTRNNFSVTTPTFVSNSSENLPRGVGFSTDGTKVYFVGQSLDRVWQFPLTTAWDIRTVDVTPTHFIGDVEGGGTGLYFSEDGRYAYVNGLNRIHQFRMQTPWNINSIPNDTQIFSVAYQETLPRDLFFSNDGTSLYVVGNTGVAPLVAGGDYVHQYTLSTAWDVTTAGWTTSFSVTAQETTPHGVYIGAAGTAMYITGQTNSRIYQYTLATPWNVSTATYDSKSFSVGSQAASPSTLTFKSDGTKVYVATNISDVIAQYSLSTAWDISTASFDNKLFYTNNVGETNVLGLYFKDDGTKFYVVGADRSSVLSFTLGTAWDISTAYYDHQSLGMVAYDTSQQGLYFKSDGTRVYIVGTGNNAVVSVGLATAWDLSTATVSSVGIPASTNNVNALVFKPDGTKLYTLERDNDFIQQHFLSSPWNVSSIYYDFKWKFLRYFEGNSVGLSFKNDGTKFYVVGTDRRRVYSFPLETPWEISPYFSNYSFRFIEWGARDLYFKPDGTKVYVVGERAVGIGLTHDSEYVHEFSLSTAWNLNTVGYTTSVGVGTALETSPQGLFFKDDGSKMYVVGVNSDRVYQYNLTTPWSISSASYENKNVVISQDANPKAVYIGAAGTAMYIVGDSNDRIFQYTLGTAWDVSTATYTNNNYAVGSQDTSPQSIWFKDDGTKMYIIGIQNDRVFQYSLSTPWNITTASYNKKSYSVGSYGPVIEGSPFGLAFSSDGSKFYIVGDANHRITEIPLSTPWDVENSPVDNALNTSIISPTYGFDFKCYSISTIELDPQGLFFKSDGTTMYVVGFSASSVSGLVNGGEYVHQFSLSTPWDVNTVGYTTSFIVTNQDGSPTDVYVGAAGTALYVLGDQTDRLYRYTLSTPWDVGTASTTVGITSVSLNNLGISTTFRETSPTGLTFKPDGTKFYVVGGEKDTIFQYTLSTAWDITTASVERQYYIGNVDSNPHAIDFRPDGTHMYIIGASSTGINEFILSVPWDISTALWTGFGISIDASIRGLYFKPDGTSVYIANLSNDHIQQINLKDPWNLFAPSSKTLNVSINNINLVPSGTQLSPDLQRLYIVGNNRGLYQFDFNH